MGVLVKTWKLLAGLRSSWQYSVALGIFSLLVATGSSWQLLEALSCSWQLLKDFAFSWQLLSSLGSYWQPAFCTILVSEHLLITLNRTSVKRSIVTGFYSSRSYVFRNNYCGSNDLLGMVFAARLHTSSG